MCSYIDWIILFQFDSLVNGFGLILTLGTVLRVTGQGVAGIVLLRSVSGS